MRDAEVVVFIALDVVLACVVIAGNILVCYVIIKSRTLRKKAMYVFVTSLAIADLLVGLIAIPCAILTRLGLPYDIPLLCVIMLSFIMITTQISIFNMTAISIERYFAIRYPRIHFMKFTPKTSFCIILITWFLSAVIGLLPLFGWNKISNSNTSASTSSTQPIEKKPLNETANIYFETTRAAEEQITTLSNNSIIHELTKENLSSSETTHKPCTFITVMDEDYMFFNFVACVLPPLLICAGLYFEIFRSLKGTNNSIKLADKNYHKAHRSETFLSKSSPDQSLESPLSPRQNGGGGSAVTFDLAELQLSEDNRDGTETNEENSSHSHNHNNGKVKNLQVTLGDYEGKQVTHQTSLLRTIYKKKESFYLKNSISGSETQISANQAKKTRLISQSSRQRSISDSNHSNLESPSLYRKSLRHIRTRKEVRAAGVLGVIVLAFVICWLPIHVINTIKRFNERLIIQPWLYDVAIFLTHSNSAINFFLYSWRLKAFRIQLRRLLSRKLPCFFHKHPR